MEEERRASGSEADREPGAPRLIDALPEPIVVLDAAGAPRRWNEAFDRLGEGAAEAVAGGVRDRLIELGGRRYSAEMLGETAGERTVRLRPDGPEDCRSRALGRYLSGLAAGQPPLQAAQTGLADGVRWRWAFVTRFNPRMLKQVQVLYWTEHGEPGEPFDYRVEGTPCERVFDGTEDRCRVFSDLPTVFPHDPWIQRTRAQEYVGQVYCTRDGVPLGHLFTVSDRPAAGRSEARAVVELLSHLVSYHLRALSWSELVDRATQQAYRDPLTGVASRAAFEQAVDYFDGSPAIPGREISVVYLDLDNLKEVNDERGHPEGDRMLATFAHHLSSEVRPQDSLFRVGGDEFVLIVESGLDAAALERRIGQVSATLHEHGFEGFSVSYGAAGLAEVDGRLREAIRLADLRMYEMKRRPGRKATEAGTER